MGAVGAGVTEEESLPVRAVGVNGPAPTRRAMMVVVAVSGVLRILAAFVMGPVVLSDSARYTQGLDMTGSRGSPAPLVQGVWSAPTGLALITQVLLSSLAWGALAFVVGRLPRCKIRAWGSLVFVLVISWSPVVLTYDAAILTESLATSGVLAACVAVFALVVPRVQETIPRRVSFVLCALGILVAVLSRPPTVLLVLPMAAAGIVLGFRSGLGRSTWAGLILATVVVCCGGWAGWAQSHASAQQSSFVAQNLLTLRATSDYVALAERAGMPTCSSLTPQELVAAVRATYAYKGLGPLQVRWRHSDAAGALRERFGTECPAIVGWLQTDSAPTSLEWLEADPVEVLTLYQQDLVNQSMPQALSPPAPNEIRKLSAVAVVALNVTAMALLAFAWVGTLRRRGADTRGAHWLTAVMVCTWGAYSFVTWLADAMEMPRHVLPVTMLLAPLGLLAFLAMEDVPSSVELR